MRLSTLQLAHIRRRASALGITVDAYIARMNREQEIMRAQRELGDGPGRCYEILEAFANRNGRAFAWSLS